MKQIIFIATFFLSVFSVERLFGQEEGIISSGESKLFFRTYGKGYPILIINGGPGMNSDGFTSLAMLLSAKNKTIIYDQRGTGRSVLPAINHQTITMAGMVTDIENLRKHLGVEKWIILGHSFGGMLASYYATKYPQHISGIILSSSGGIDLGLRNYAAAMINNKLSPAQQQQLRHWSQEIANGDTSYHAQLKRGLALAPAYVYDTIHIPVIAERLTQGNSTINSLVWQDMESIKFDCKTKLSGASFPVLIIQGKQDIVKPETAELAHNAFKNSTIIYLDNCVHYGWLDNPEKYFKAVHTLINQAM